MGRPRRSACVLDGLGPFAYRPDSTLYEVLFATTANRNVAWPDPVADSHPNDTVTHLREQWFPEKALFEEYAIFGRGHAHDLAPFDRYFDEDVRGLKWPVVNGKETQWRFTPTTIRTPPRARASIFTARR